MTVVIFDSEAEHYANKCIRNMPRDFDGTFLQYSGMEFVGPPTLEEWRHEMHCSLYDPHCNMSDAELHALLVLYK